MYSKKEPVDIHAIRVVFWHWPFRRGKGILLKGLSPLLRHRTFAVEVASGVWAQFDMNDWITVHELVQGYDADFEHSWRLIRSGSTVLDVGANIGMWAIGAARRTGPTGCVHAFEPFDKNFQRLTENLALNDVSNVRAQQIALMDRDGEFKFYPSPNNNSGVGRVVPEDWDGPHSRVPAMTLDQYCELYGLGPVDLLKLDVEGAEYFVLKGATKLLGSVNPPIIIFEVERVMTRQLNYDPEDIQVLLADFGYSIFALRKGRWQPATLAGFLGPEDLLGLPRHRVSNAGIVCRPQTGC